jgi:hypothetical protein
LLTTRDIKSTNFKLQAVAALIQISIVEKRRDLPISLYLLTTQIRMMVLAIMISLDRNPSRGQVLSKGQDLSLDQDLSRDQDPILVVSPSSLTSIVWLKSGLIPSPGNDDYYCDDDPTFDASAVSAPDVQAGPDSGASPDVGDQAAQPNVQPGPTAADDDAGLDDDFGCDDDDDDDDSLPQGGGGGGGKLCTVTALKALF